PIPPAPMRSRTSYPVAPEIQRPDGGAGSLSLLGLSETRLGGFGDESRGPSRPGLALLGVVASGSPDDALASRGGRHAPGGNERRSLTPTGVPSCFASITASPSRDYAGTDRTSNRFRTLFRHPISEHLWAFAHPGQSL